MLGPIRVVGNTSHPDERVVYLALRNVSKGSDTNARQLQKIRRSANTLFRDCDLGVIEWLILFCFLTAFGWPWRLPLTTDMSVGVR